MAPQDTVIAGLGVSLAGIALAFFVNSFPKTVQDAIGGASVLIIILGLLIAASAAVEG